ncbi:hypothetical protein EVAR_83794_1 [Eumeta japonica]|uniref:Uncharacterized protein n=1 Tax=Eumeta variegata TaxID=151549 RepID=A0A4C1WIB1_EUMVA|nr:hypothetical protein EVAR_83794_1 [Eumeta japonica]
MDVKRVGRKKGKEKLTDKSNFGELLAHCTSKHVGTVKFTNENEIAPNRTLRNKCVNVLHLDPVSKSSKSTHKKKSKKKNANKKNVKVENKTFDNKKINSASYFGTNSDYQQNCDNLTKKLDDSVMVDKGLFPHRNEVPVLKCQTESNFIFNGFKSNQNSSVESLHCALDTHSLNEKTINGASYEKDSSVADDCPKSSLSPKVNVTFDLNSSESSLCRGNVINTTYDKTSTEKQSTEGNYLNKTFDKIEHEIISTDLDIKENVSQLKNHLTKNTLDNINQTMIDSKLELGTSLIRQETFTKESKTCVWQMETAPCATSTDITLQSGLTYVQSVKKDIAPAGCCIIPPTTSVEVIFKESDCRPKRSHTGAAALHTPVLHTSHILYTTIPAASSERKVKAPLRTQLPDFAALHRKQFARMESLDECQRRRALRAQRLIQSRPAHTPGDPQRKRALAAPPGGSYNRFGFKAQPAAVANAGMRMASETRARSRTLLQGVRTNRRFELLMKARRGAP